MRVCIATLLCTVLLLAAAMMGGGGGGGCGVRAAVPSKVTECRGTTGGTDFCAKIAANITWGIGQKFAPGICAAAVVFPPIAPPPSDSEDVLLLHGLRGRQNNKESSLDFPGWSPASKVFISSTGRYTYDDWASVDDDDVTMFDMASVSKIMGATTAVAQLYQKGVIDLDEKVSSPRLLGRDFASQPNKDEITVKMLLLHQSGFPPDPTPYWYSDPKFAGGACKNNQRYHPAQDFSCFTEIFDDLIFNQQLINPPNAKYVYSDLNFITLAYIVGTLVKRYNLVALGDYPPVCASQEAQRALTCHFYAYVHVNVFKRYNLASTMWIPNDPMRNPPMYQDTTYRHALVMGYASDSNAYASGGIQGHAGIFSTARDVLKWLSVWNNEQDPAMLNATTIKLFTTVNNASFSSRALGWDTNDHPTDPPCGTMSKKTFTHNGWTGTQICASPDTGLTTVLLGNGRYPKYTHDGMITFRPIYNTLVKDLML